MSDQTDGLADQIQAIDHAGHDPNRALLEELAIVLAAKFSSLAERLEKRLCGVASARISIRFDRLVGSLVGSVEGGSSDRGSRSMGQLQSIRMPSLLEVAVAETMLGNEAAIGTPSDRPLTEMENNLLQRLRKDYLEIAGDLFPGDLCGAPTAKVDQAKEADPAVEVQFDVTVGSLQSQCCVVLPISVLLDAWLANRPQEASPAKFQVAVEAEAGFLSAKRLLEIGPGEVFPLENPLQLVIDGVQRGTVSLEPDSGRGGVREAKIDSIR